MSKASQVIGTYMPDNLIADNIHPIDTKAVAIATGSSTLVRGTLINATGAMCTAKTDVPVGILCEDVTQNASNTTGSTMYISGSFVADAITVGSSVTALDFSAALQNLGIFLK